METENKKKSTAKICLLAVLVAGALAAVALIFSSRSHSVQNDVERRADHQRSASDASHDKARQPKGKTEVVDVGEEPASEGDDGECEQKTAEEKKSESGLLKEEDEENVAAFDSLTDKWTQKNRGDVTIKDVDAFVAAFKSVPRRRQGECLQRALNLVPDGNVLLLAGILFDKTIDKEYVELVFNDVLNRDESVKKMILPMIYKDKTHPCWADTAWILDVTGETPNKENKQ